MSDLIERLRDHCFVLTDEAADEIERLRGLLREALNAWRGEGPPINMDRIEAVLVCTHCNGTKLEYDSDIPCRQCAALADQPSEVKG